MHPSNSLPFADDLKALAYAAVAVSPSSHHAGVSVVTRGGLGVLGRWGEVVRGV